VHPLYHGIVTEDRPNLKAAASLTGAFLFHDFATENNNMASIVYEGVGGGGQLFAGLKFFLLQRLPTRDRFKELVKVCLLF
jgi:hypothetical protein